MKCKKINSFLWYNKFQQTKIKKQKKLTASESSMNPLFSSYPVPLSAICAFFVDRLSTPLYALRYLRSNSFANRSAS